jgi:asparagine synthase (glutamine-hydrolysing)
LDADWVEWTARLPKRLKIRGRQTKWLLKAAFSEKLPSDIIRRSKQGFGVPVGPWLRHELRDWSHSILIGNPDLAELFSQDAVKHLLDEHNTGKVNHGKRLWALLMFALWQERYLVSIK